MSKSTLEETNSVEERIKYLPIQKSPEQPGLFNLNTISKETPPSSPCRKDKQPMRGHRK